MTATLLYLTLVIIYSRAFDGQRPTLREAFPRLFKHENDPSSTRSDKPVAVHHDEPVLYHDERALWKTLLLGIPDWNEWEFSYITIALNILVTLLSLDLVYRGPLLHDGKELAFARIGYVDDTTAKVLVREPDTSNLPLYVYLKPIGQPEWTMVDTIFHLDEDTDFTYPILFSSLQADTSYLYSLSNELKGGFMTAPPRGSQKAKLLTFLTSSCIKANFPYQPFSNSLSIHGFKHLAKVLKNLPSPAAFMLFLGDFIYVDVPLRLASTTEHYRSEYRRVYKSPSWQLPGVTLPWLHTLDDHEIANDWAGGNVTDPFPAASDPFINYHVSVNPPFPPKTPIGPKRNTTYFQFTQGPASFFMLDTRRYRTRPEQRNGSLFGITKPFYGSSTSQEQQAGYAPSMLGPAQFDALVRFLLAPEPSGVYWKFVASSVPFTKNWRVGTSDTWGGFLSERSKVLEAMHFAENNLGVRVVILSGDRHEFAAVRFPQIQALKWTQTGTQQDSNDGPHEFSVGPLSMFYLPFRTFEQVDQQDVKVAYFPDGNSKVGSIEIVANPSSNLGNIRSIMKYTLWVDGKAAWTYNIESPAAGLKHRSNIDSWRRSISIGH